METKDFNEAIDQVADTVNESATNAFAIESIEFADALNIDAIPQNAEFQCIQDFVEAPMNSKKSRDIKKIAAAAIMIADETDAEGVPDYDFESPEDYATVADDSLDRLKMNYKVGTGEMSVGDVVDYYIDKTAAKVKSAVEIFVENKMPVLTNKLCSWIENKFPSARALTTTARVFVPHFAKKALPYVKTGIDMISNGVKTIAHKAGNALVAAGRMISNGAKRLLSIF